MERRRDIYIVKESDGTCRNVQNGMVRRILMPQWCDKSKWQRMWPRFWGSVTSQFYFPTWATVTGKDWTTNGWPQDSLVLTHQARSSTTWSVQSVQSLVRVHVIVPFVFSLLKIDGCRPGSLADLSLACNPLALNPREANFDSPRLEDPKSIWSALLRHPHGCSTNWVGPMYVLKLGFAI